MPSVDKTNVMRLLEQKNIPYTSHEYDPSIVDGISVAAVLLEDPDYVFKTLVTRSESGEYFVFVVPVAETLDLKKAAKVVLVKSLSMIRQKELLPLTGYIHGGCSPVGMKRPFHTVIDETAGLCDKIYVSAGRVGFQIEITPGDLAFVTGANYADLTAVSGI